MKKNYLFLIFSMLCISNFLKAQITVLDFESATTSTTFQYFGSSLEPQLTAVIDNPDKTGINTSAKVSNFKKPAASQTWAGAFSSPNPATQVDLTSGGQVCIKVWADHVGNLALKFEGATDGTPNWLQTQNITETNKWVELCFDPSKASEEAPNNTAAGHSYKTVVLFFDFGTVLSEEKTWFFDDLIIKTGSSGPKKVTFNVDMKNYTATFGKVYVSGTFNSWSGDANELKDADGDKVYSAELTLPQGAHEYKFTIDNWTKQEEFNGLELCTITDPSGQFHNRSLTVVNDKVLETVCWNSCYACGEGVKIAFQLATSSVTPSADGVYLVGGGNFDPPGGKHRMQDADKDGVYTISVERKKGFSSFYSFANGNCPDYSCKENIAGQDCANPNNFNDRFLPPVTKDTTITTCFGFCSKTATCANAPKSGNITFKVDMSKSKETFTKIYVSGTFNNWSGDANELTDANNDKIYEGTINNISAGKHEFKFQLDAWAKSEQFKGGEDCTITDPSGQFVNRKMEVNGDAVLPAFCYNACVTCDKFIGTKEVVVSDLIRIAPTVANDVINITFNENTNNEAKEIFVFNPQGQQVMYQNLTVGNNATLQCATLSNGFYIIKAKVGQQVQTAKVIVSH